MFASRPGTWGPSHIKGGVEEHTPGGLGSAESAYATEFGIEAPKSGVGVKPSEPGVVEAATKASIIITKTSVDRSQRLRCGKPHPFGSPDLRGFREARGRFPRRVAISTDRP